MRLYLMQSLHLVVWCGHAVPVLKLDSSDPIYYEEVALMRIISTQDVQNIRFDHNSRCIDTISDHGYLCKTAAHDDNLIWFD
jgi:hypothetical protein